MVGEVMLNITSPEQAAIKELEVVHKVDETERMGVRVSFSLASVKKTEPGHAEITPLEDAAIDLAALHFEGSSTTQFSMFIGRTALNESTRKAAKHMSRDHGEIIVTPTGEVQYVDHDSTYGSERVTPFGIIKEKKMPVDRNRSTSVLIPINIHEAEYLVVHIEVDQRTKEQNRYTAQRKATQKQTEIRDMAENGKNIPTENIQKYAEYVRDAAPEDETELYQQVVETLNAILEQREERISTVHQFIDSPKPIAIIESSNPRKYLGGVNLEQLNQEIQLKKQELNGSNDPLIAKLEDLAESLKP